MSEQRTGGAVLAPPHPNGIDLTDLTPILVDQTGQRGPRTTLALTIVRSEEQPRAILTVGARRLFRPDAHVEYLGSARVPDALAIRATPPGTRYAVPLNKRGALPTQIVRLLTERGWEPGRHPAEWRDGVLVVRRNRGGETA